MARDARQVNSLRLAFSRLSTQTARVDYISDVLEWFHTRLAALEADAGIEPEDPPSGGKGDDDYPHFI